MIPFFLRAAIALLFTFCDCLPNLLLPTFATTQMNFQQ
jgi:hypothetical protein